MSKLLDYLDAPSFFFCAKISLELFKNCFLIQRSFLGVFLMTHFSYNFLILFHTALNSELNNQLQPKY